MTLTDGVGHIVGANGVTTSIVGGKLTITGADCLWIKADAGTDDWYLRPAVYAEDVRLKSAAVGNPDVIWLEGDTGMSHFASDMYIGGAAGVADSKLHIKDTVAGRYGARITLENANSTKIQMGIADTGDAFIETLGAHGITFIVNGTHIATAMADKSRFVFENSVKTEGYIGLSNVGGVQQTVMWSLDCANGNFLLNPEATLTFEAIPYRMPTSAPAAAGYVLGYVSGTTPYQLGWIDAGGYWTRYAYGDIDTAIRPVTDNDSIHTRQSVTSAVTFRAEGASGKSWFLSDMAVGAVEVTPADPSTLFQHGAKLHVIDEARSGAWAQFLHSTMQAQHGVDDAGRGFINTIQATGLSFSTNSTQRAMVKDDGSEWSFEQSIVVAGYAVTNTGDVMWSFDSATGNMFLDEDATTQIGGYLYTWPKTGAALGEVLVVGAISDSSITLDWAVAGGYWKRTGTVLEPVTAGDYVKATRFYTGTADYLYSSSDGEIRVVGANYAVMYGSTGFLVVGATAVYPKLNLDLGIVTTNAFKDGFFTGTVNATKFALDASNFISEATATVLRLTGEVAVQAYAGATHVWYADADEFRPGADGTIQCGTSARRWSNVYSVAGNFSGDVTIATAATGLIMSSNTQYEVLLADGNRFLPSALPKQALPTHAHGLTYTSTASSNWTAGSPASYTLQCRNSAGAIIYVQASTNSDGSGASWQDIRMVTSPHTHTYDKADTPTDDAIV